jgi:hypothetical protein
MEVEGQLEATEVRAVIRHQAVDRQIGFSDQEPIGIGVCDAPHSGDSLVNLGLVHGVPSDDASGRGHPFTPIGVWWVVAELAIFEEMVDGIDPEAIDPPRKPEAKHVEHGGSHFRVSPIQVGLLF